MPWAGWALVLCLFHAAASGGERDAAAVVRDFYARLSGGDVVAARELWTAAGRPRFERKYARIAAVRCMRLESLDVDAADAEGDTTTVDVVATIAEWHAAASTERLARRQSQFRLRRAGGAWRIEEWVETEQQLADEIARAETDAQRRELLNAHAELVGLELGEALTKRALTLSNERRLNEAAAVNVLARRIAEDHLDERLLSKVIGVESVLARQPEPPDSAASIALAEESVRLARTSGHPDTLLLALLRLIRARRVADPGGPIDLFEGALELTGGVEDLASAALVATQAAWYYDDRRLHRQALIYSLLAEKLADVSGDLTARLSAEMNLGGTYMYKFDFSLANPHNERALALAREANFRATEASILERLAIARFQAGDAEGALSLANEMLEIAEALPSSILLAPALVLRAEYQLTLGEFSGAEADLTRALAAAKQTGDRNLINQVLAVTGALRYEQGRYEEVAAMRGWPGVRAKALIALGRHEEAEAVLRASIAGFEDQRPDVSVDPRQIRELMKMTTPAANDLVDLLLKCGRVEEALQELERRKASVLRDVLAQAGVASSSLHPDERKRLHELETNLVLLNRKARARDSASAHHEVALTRLELADFWSRIYATHPELRWSSVPPAPLGQLARATQGITYVSYAVTDDQTIVFVVSQDGVGAPAVRAVVIPIARRELGARVRQFVRQVETRDLTAGANAEALYDLLLRPVEGELFRRGQRICIIPDDELWRLPFHALKPARSTYVTEKASVFYAPSISVVNALMTRDGEILRNAPRLLAFGNPAAAGASMHSLPDAEWEVREIARLYAPDRRRVRMNGSADESTFKADAPGYDVVHIAAHALLDDSPMYSAVLLSDEGAEDGRLEAREIASMRLDARVVVISACETARGDHQSGEGVVGLPWALLATGARSSVVSLWPVDSTATAKLMQELHRRLIQSDFASVSDALRGAQLTLLRSDQYSHPYYWAPFVAIGAD